jgi:hypothetical protein
MIWLLSGVGHVPAAPNVGSDIWDCVESYVIRMLLTCRLKITVTSSLKLIISFLVSIYYYLLPSLNSHSSPVRFGMLLFLFLLCCIYSLGPRGLLQHSPGFWSLTSREHHMLFMTHFILSILVGSFLRSKEELMRVDGKGMITIIVTIPYPPHKLFTINVWAPKVVDRSYQM